MRLPERLKPVVDFAVQVITGMLLFALVFGVAILISIGVRVSEDYAPVWVRVAADYTEKFVFALDLGGFLLFSLAETLRLARSLWEDWSS